MNYTLRKLNCKALIGAFFAILLSFAFLVNAYAATYTVRKIPSFWFDDKYVFFAEGVSPRSSSLTSVAISYDTLADLVYYCNEHRLSTSLVYNTTLGVYVGFLDDTAFKITELGISSVYGLLCNSAGKVYVAEKEASGGNTTINNNTYNYNHTVINPSPGGSTRTPTSTTAPSYWEEIETLKGIYSKVDFADQYLSIISSRLGLQTELLIDMVHSLERNVAPALEAINNNLISFKDSTVAGLQNLHSDLTFTSNVLLTQLNTQNRIYSSVTGLGSRLDTLVANSTGTNSRLDKLVTNGTGLATRLDTLITSSAGIDSRLDSIINNGAVQVNTSSIDARLDKLISMYSKVNSVVLDTAAINGGQIKAAVGGELEDVMFWGYSSRANSKFITNTVQYTLNGATQHVAGVPIRGLYIGTSVPASIHVDDALIESGIWQAGGKYRISDTYNAATGELVQRLGSTVYDGSEAWKMTAKTDGVNLFYLKDSAFDAVEENIFCYPSRARYTYSPYASAFNGEQNAASAYTNMFTVWRGNIRFCVSADEFPDLAAWKKGLKNIHAAGSPLEVWFVRPSAVRTTLDRATIAIPEGDSIISADRIRITGKYETYGSYTQTADIIAAINNIPPYDDSGLIAAITGMTTPTVTTDLTEVTSRLDLILGELQSSSGSATCEHTYAQHMEQEELCTLPGLMISTCSKCGDSYSEIVDPLGHDWVVSSHVDAVIDPDTGEETASAYDVYTCSRCERTYEDHTGDGAPDEDYSSTSISKLIVQVFSKLGTFAGKLIGFFVHLLDKALTSVDNVISKFNDYTTQISGFGGSYTTWLTGFWGIIPAELQIALTFSVICMVLGAVGKKLLFS